ncbi:MAG: alpha/beta hydrolase [Planctomycetes bacterium]|nr:alpha/beta hydrolase [Planctomycetota bacterium]MCP4770986.1 alpha/beta hydrolase [Planctomycetota bacterium]MCP4861705.1 alpha/beta hydrolase [Planctomycetota bacterium]
MLLASGILLFASCASVTKQPSRELLWSQGAPGAKGNNPEKDCPAITIYSPSQREHVGTAIIVCPGGGYVNLAMGHEGLEIATWLNSLGVTAVVLEYRRGNGGYAHPIPIQDAQRAMRTVRSRAEELGLDPQRIGILGFSAGGHLASTAGTHFDDGNAAAVDPIERFGCRPDFMVLCYPVIAFDEPFTHRGSQHRLLGKEPSAELLLELSNEKQVTVDTPPTFLFHTDEDDGVLAENSVAFYQALRKAKVPAELHIYRQGRHGLGLAHDVVGTAGWPAACSQWMRGLGLLDKTSPTEPSP